MNRRKEIDEHVLKCARTLYEETRVPMADIAKMMGISDRTLQTRAALLGWLPRPNSRARRPLGIGPEADTADPAILAKTVCSRLEREIMDAERNLTRPDRARRESAMLNGRPAFLRA